VSKKIAEKDKDMAVLPKIRGSTTKACCVVSTKATKEKAEGTDTAGPCSEVILSTSSPHNDTDGHDGRTSKKLQHGSSTPENSTIHIRHTTPSVRGHTQKNVNTDLADTQQEQNNNKKQKQQQQQQGAWRKTSNEASVDLDAHVEHVFANLENFTTAQERQGVGRGDVADDDDRSDKTGDFIAGGGNCANLASLSFGNRILN